MTQYDEVNENLHTLGWSPFAQPSPAPVELAFTEGKSVDEVTQLLHQYVRNAYTASAFYPTYEQASYSIFGPGAHFAELDTSIALGQQTEAPVEKIADARLVEDFLYNLNHGYNRLGYKDGNCGPESEQGKLRRDAAKIPPPGWKGYEEIWELAVLSGSIQVGLTGFDQAYANNSPKFKEIRGLDAQQYLDNLWTPGTWKPTQAAK